MIQSTTATRSTRSGGGTAMAPRCATVPEGMAPTLRCSQHRSADTAGASGVGWTPGQQSWREARAAATHQVYGRCDISAEATTRAVSSQRTVPRREGRPEQGMPRAVRAIMAASLGSAARRRKPFRERPRIGGSYTTRYRSYTTRSGSYTTRSGSYTTRSGFYTTRSGFYTTRSESWRTGEPDRNPQDAAGERRVTTSLRRLRERAWAGASSPHGA